MNTINALKLGFRAGAATLVSITIAFAGLFLATNSASAGAPNLTVSYLGNNNNDPSDSFDHDVTLNQGQMVQLYTEIHNTNVPSVANNVKVKVALPSSSGSTTATVSADNASSVSDSVNLTVNGGGQLRYVPGSTEVNCHSNANCTNGTVGDGIVGNGIVLGDQTGCNDYIIQVSFLVEVIAPQASPSPSPTPVVSPSPSPSPATGGDTVINNNNNNTNNNSNSQSQNVTVNNPAAPAVLSAATVIPKKQPDTGVGILGLASMFSAAPFGVVLSRYGRGRLISGKREEDNSDIASELVKERSGKRLDA